MQKDLQNLEKTSDKHNSKKTLEITIKEKDKETSNFNQEILLKRKKRNTKIQIIKDLELELREQNKRQQSYLKSIQENEVKANRLDVSLEAKLSQLEIGYTITFEKAKQTYGKGDNIIASNKILKDLKNVMKRLGSVNIGAIDEYERLNDRYSFLMEQKRILLKQNRRFIQLLVKWIR